MYNYTLVYPTHTPKVFQSTSTFFDLGSTSATLEVKLGQGSFGSVWRAKHRQSGDTALGHAERGIGAWQGWDIEFIVWKYGNTISKRSPPTTTEVKKERARLWSNMFQFTNQRIVSVLVFLPHIPQPAWDTGSWILHTVSLFLKFKILPSNRPSYETNLDSWLANPPTWVSGHS